VPSPKHAINTRSLARSDASTSAHAHCHFEPLPIFSDPGEKFPIQSTRLDRKKNQLEARSSADAEITHHAIFRNSHTSYSLENSTILALFLISVDYFLRVYRISWTFMMHQSSCVCNRHTINYAMMMMMMMIMVILEQLTCNHSHISAFLSICKQSNSMGSEGDPLVFARRIWNHRILQFWVGFCV